MTLPALVEAMLDPSFYPHRPSRVELVQTHISYVFLAGDEVYKIKKPVRFRFLDFSTSAQRLRFCREELRLNRRLAPATYLGLNGVRTSDAGYALTAEDDPRAIDYAVHMRRLPEDRMMSALLERGEVTGSMADTLVDRLASFHRSARSGAEVSAHGMPDAIASVMAGSFATGRRFRSDLVDAREHDAIESFCLRFLANNRPLLERRIADGRVRECHGDLHTEHVCFVEPLEIFDCVEFSEEIRCCDVASEMAFLAMDLAYHRRSDLAERLIARYAETTADTALSRLVPFYACHRAYIRAMVDGLAASEPELPDDQRSKLKESARRHFLLAYRYAWTDRRCLVVFCGLSGSGKSTLAAAVERRIGWRRWSSDVVRKQIAGMEPLERVASDRIEWLYSPQMSARTYSVLYAEAQAALAAGNGAVLDATFLRRVDRDQVRRLAARLRVPILIVECRCSEEEIARRLAERNNDASDADWKVYLHQRRTHDAIALDEPAILSVDTTRGLADALRVVEKRLDELTARDALQLEPTAEGESSN